MHASKPDLIDKDTPPKRSLKRMRWVLVFSFFLIVLGSASTWLIVAHHPVGAQQDLAATGKIIPSMGVNLAWSGDSNGDFLFADAFKTWRLQPAPGQNSAPSLDASGWPQGDFSAFLWDGAFLPHTSGTYAIRFNGLATLGLVLVGGSITNQVYDAGSNTTTATVTITGDSSPSLTFVNTQRSNTSPTHSGVTNVQLMRPTAPGASTSYSFSTVFTTAVKTFLTRFTTIRFMDTTSTNGSTEANWSDRVLPQSSQDSRAAWEYVIQLCNETGKDAYINVPELATTDYISQLARLFKYGSDATGTVYTTTQSNPVHPPLASNVHVYIENSNEVWNGTFEQMHQNHDAALAEVQAGGSPLNYDGETGEWNLSWRRIALRAKLISDGFRAVFGDAAMPPNANPQIRPIFEWQYGNSQDTANSGLSFLNNYFNNAKYVATPHPINYFLYGGGGAAYIGPNNPGASSVDAIYASGLDTTIGDAGIGTIASDIQYLRPYGLHEIAYEGGFQVGGDYLSSLQSQANQDPRAKDFEIQAQSFFTQQGGELLMYFDSTSRNYGLTGPTVLDAPGPKLQAIDAILQNGVPAPSGSGGVALPTSVPSPTSTSVPSPTSTSVPSPTSTPVPSSTATVEPSPTLVPIAPQPTNTPIATATPTSNVEFSSGFENGDHQTTWINTIDDTGAPAGATSSVGGVCCALSAAETGPRNEIAHQGNAALMYSGFASGDKLSSAYTRVFDLTSASITVNTGTTLDYWIYPQSTATFNLVSGNNSTCVALDVIFSDSTGHLSNLRDSGAVDQNGNRAHPAFQCNKLTLDSWNHVIINLGDHSNGLKMLRIDLGYEQTGSTGGYRGYIDDVSIHN